MDQLYRLARRKYLENPADPSSFIYYWAQLARIGLPLELLLLRPQFTYFSEVENLLQRNIHLITVYDRSFEEFRGALHRTIFNEEEDVHGGAPLLPKDIQIVYIGYLPGFWDVTDSAEPEIRALGVTAGVLTVGRITINNELRDVTYYISMYQLGERLYLDIETMCGGSNIQPILAATCANFSEKLPLVGTNKVNCWHPMYYDDFGNFPAESFDHCLPLITIQNSL